MNDQESKPEDVVANQAAEPAEISLEQLSESFAQLIGEKSTPSDEVASGSSDARADSAETTESTTEEDQVYSLEDTCPTSPRTILEAMLFVGHPGNEPLTNRQVASLIRGVSPSEVDACILELNGLYETQQAPYRIVSEGKGYRMALLPEFDTLRERFYGRIRQVRLSQSAIDVLALVAYNQPMTKKEVEEIRQQPSGSVLGQLVRRELLRIERVEDEQAKKKSRRTLYRTTDRFLELFGLQTLADLPESHEMDA